MASPFAETQQESDSLLNNRKIKDYVCSQCGGNGYMKSSPNCYHTCLDCLGRGFIKKELTND